VCRPVYPCIDPAVVVLTTCGDYALLRHERKPSHGLVSAIMGLVEAGESLEQAATREVLEQTGVKVRLEGTWHVASLQ
jgi:NAD+ diphosphatase